VSLNKIVLLFLPIVCLNMQVMNADTLRGFCVSPTPTCTDDGTITPTSANPPNFGFQSSGTTQGEFELVLLAPNNDIVSPGAFSLKIDGSNVTKASATSTLVSTTAFTSGKLENYLGLSYTPSNPLNHYLPLTQSVDALATGYYVYTFNFGMEAGDPKNINTAPTFSLDGGILPLGSLLFGLEFNGDQVLGATTPSGAILETKNPAVPEPATAGLLGAALVGCYFIRKKVRVGR
jgi:PEP-CTERM motif